MQMGIVAEGPADIAVLRNILKGWLGLGREDVYPIRPELAEDETDAAPGYRQPPPAQFSNWELVFQECRDGAKIRNFLDNVLAGDRFVVVQIDTAEADRDGYDVTRPNRKAPEYVEQLRALVAAKLNSLLGPELAVRVRYAIAVEETDAWILTLHDDGKKETGSILNPKKRLESLLPSLDLKKASKSVPARADALTQGFRTRKKLEAATKRNRSLKLFVESLPTIAVDGTESEPG